MKPHPPISQDRETAGIVSGLEPPDVIQRLLADRRARREQAQLLRAATEQQAEQGDVPEPAKWRATAAGDERRLRGIPAIGRGVAGEITGTRPDKAVGERR